MEYLSWVIWGRENIDVMCENLIKEMVGSIGLGLVDRAYLRHLHLWRVVCCPSN